MGGIALDLFRTELVRDPLRVAQKVCGRLHGLSGDSLPDESPEMIGGISELLWGLSDDRCLWAVELVPECH